MVLPTNFQNENYFDILPALNELRESKLFCDITLKVDNEMFPAHRNVLVVACKYFKNMLTGKFIESEKDVIHLEDLNSVAIKILLDYIYTGNLLIGPNDVEEVLKTADFLQLKWPKDVCSKYLENCLNLENAIETLELARECFCDDLQIKASDLILINLCDLSKTEEFHKLDFEKIEELLRRSQILSISSDIIFNAIMSWTEYDLDERKSMLASLLNHINTETISEKFFKTVICKTPILRDDLSTTNWILNINLKDENIFIASLSFDLNCYKYNIKEHNSIILNTKKPPIRYYYPVYYKDNIYLTGGNINGELSSTCPIYNVQNDLWNEVQLESDRFHHSACVLDDKLYIIGGYWREENKDDVKCYEFETGQLTTLKSMDKKRSSFGISVQNQNIYACGGDYNLNFAERYDIREGKWTMLPKMDDLRGDCTAAALSDAIYCSQSFEGIVKKFNIRRNCWEDMPNLPARIWKSLVSSGGHIYAITKNGILRFNSYDNCWNTIYQQTFCNDPLIGISFSI